MPKTFHKKNKKWKKKWKGKKHWKPKHKKKMGIPKIIKWVLVIIGAFSSLVTALPLILIGVFIFTAKEFGTSNERLKELAFNIFMWLGIIIVFGMVFLSCSNLFL